MPPGGDAESLKQYYRMKEEQQDLMRQYEGATATGAQDGEAQGAGQVGIVRQDWTNIKQTLAPKNAIRLIQCYGVMEPLLVTAVGSDQELKARVLDLFQIRSRAPKIKQSDEVQFCQQFAYDQIPLFRRHCSIPDLCQQLAITFGELIAKHQK